MQSENLPSFPAIEDNMAKPTREDKIWVDTKIEKALQCHADTCPHGREHGTILPWAKKNWFNLAVLAVAVGAWFQPQISSHLSEDAKLNVANEVAKQLVEPNKQISSISKDVSEIKGQLAVLAPIMSQMISKKLSEAKSLDQLKAVVQLAKQGQVNIDPVLVAKTGQSLVEQSTQTPAAWGAALEFVNYKSYANRLSLAIPPVPTVQEGFTTKYYAIAPTGLSLPVLSFSGVVPKDSSAELESIGQDQNKDLAVGNAYLFSQGGAITIDGMEMKNVVFINTRIFYSGGPVIMKNVFFVNCTFEMPPGIRSAQSFASAFLSQGPAITFKSA